jgi:hypothetical protein
VITLWVSDRNGTVDAHAVIVQVDPGTGTAAGTFAGGFGAWASGLLLLGLLLGVGGGRRLGGLALATLGLLMLGSPSSSEGSSSLPVPPEADPQPLQAGNNTFWSKLRFEVKLEGDNGLMLQRVRWKNILYLSSVVIPYVEVKPQGQGALKLEIPRPPKFSRLSVLQNPICDPRNLPVPGMWGVTDLGRELEAHYDLEVKDARGGRLGHLSLNFAFRFYHPSWCRNSRAPEFYPEVRYTVQGFPVEWVRVPFRLDVDANGPSTDVAMMAREPIPEVFLHTRGPETSVACSVGGQAIRPNLPLPAQGGALVCLPSEFLQENFDNYHQAEHAIIAPSCNSNSYCFHFHMLRPALRQKFIAVENYPSELEPQKLNPAKEPEALVDVPPEDLSDRDSDIVFWYIAESDKPQDAFAADRLMWPAQFAGFSCTIKGTPFGYPACE